ncbi:hypothetical protein HF319_03185 [Xanthomonas sp. Kuri4-1]
MTGPAPSRLRAALYPLLRGAFRALPLSEGLRDRWRGWFLDRHAGWVPPPPKGRAGLGGSRRPVLRGDERAIGHVPYRQAALPTPLPATLVAFYLPQFHPIEENDAWWGRGFTEWRNVTRALPQFEGHRQPRLPADLGFYDLRNPAVMREQARLAGEYGVGAFCFYFYWFGGKTLLEAPLLQWRRDTDITLPYCLCWANEKWARRWDGRGDDILIDQHHSAEDDLAFIAHVAEYLRDPRYLRVDGRPMLLVYRPHLLPQPEQTAARWRAWCRDNGVGEIHLAYVQGFERPDPRAIGFDAAVEFPPNMSTPPSVAARQILINPDFRGDVLDWRVMAREAAQRALPEYPLYPCVNPGWDNEPRRSGNGRIYLHASPRGYRDWLSNTIHHRLAGRAMTQPPLVFVNAWNEWAEGAVLEPDARLGHAWLENTRRALQAPVRPVTASTAVVIHAWYLDVLDDLLHAWARSGLDGPLIITTAHALVEQVRERAQAHAPQARVEGFDNHGRDLLPFLHVADRLLDAGIDSVLKLHTKKSTHRADGAQWRGELVDRLIEPARAAAIRAAFADRPSLGMVAPEGHLLRVGDYLGDNAGTLDYLHARLGLDPTRHDEVFASGSMFWVRLAALRPLLDAHLAPSEFEPEGGQIDGTLAHGLERLLGTVVRQAGFEVADAAQASGNPADPEPGPYRYARRS